MAAAAALWVDKHRPQALDALELHSAVNERLRKLVHSGDFPHLLFYGPAGAGKKTRVSAVLRELYGPGVERVRVDQKAFKVNSKTVDVTTVGSNYHVELNPSDAGLSDRLIVQEVIKDMAQTQTIDPSTQRSFKVVVLHEVDRLTKDAQHALRRTMEKYMSICRLVLVCESSCRVIEPLRSRCLMIRIPAPSVDDVVSVLQVVAEKERVELPDKFASTVARESGRNLRKALLMLEASKAEQFPFSDEQKARVADWERFVDDLGRLIVEEQSPIRLQIVRAKVYELLTNCIPADVVMRALTKALLRRVDDQIKHETVQWAAYYEHRMKLGSKPIFHIEAFVAKFMALYKRWVVQMWN